VYDDTFDLGEYQYVGDSFTFSMSFFIENEIKAGDKINLQLAGLFIVSGEERCYFKGGSFDFNSVDCNLDDLYIGVTA